MPCEGGIWVVFLVWHRGVAQKEKNALNVRKNTADELKITTQRDTIFNNYQSLYVEQF